MIALRIIVGIVGLGLMWVYTFALYERPESIWRSTRRASALIVIFASAFALLQFALAGHL